VSRQKVLLAQGEMAMAMCRLWLQDWVAKWNHDGKCEATSAEMVFSDGLYVLQQERCIGELKRQLDHKCYESIWSMMHRIRDALGKRDDLYQLKGMIEFDEGHFEMVTSKHTKLRRGRGSQKQINVAVMAESTPLEDPTTGHKRKHLRYLKMKALQT